MSGIYVYMHICVYVYGSNISSIDDDDDADDVCILYTLHICVYVNVAAVAVPTYLGYEYPYPS